MRKLGPTKIPRPRAKAKGLSLFPSVPQAPKGSSIYKKSALRDDPAKFGMAGFDLNMLSPSMINTYGK